MSEQVSVPPFPKIWNVPYGHAWHYVGRALEERTVVDTLKKYGAASIGGEPGTGKTRLAAELAYNHRTSYPGGVVWVDKTKGARESCASIVESQSLPGHDPIEEIDSLIEAEGGYRLWIIDDEVELPSQLKIPNPRRHVLMMSSKTLSPDVTLGPLTKEYGAELILRRVGRIAISETIQDVSPAASKGAQRLSEMLEGNPYYLVRAGVHMQDTGNTATGVANLLEGEHRHAVMRLIEQVQTTERD